MGRALDQTSPELAGKIWSGGSRLSRIASENDQRTETSHDYPISEKSAASGYLVGEGAKSKPPQ
jgi:hypothetical protein